MAQARQAYDGRAMAAMTRRILAWHDRATDAERHDGMTWYDDARRFAGALAEATPYTLAQVAHVVAALSPQCTWDENMRAAALACTLHAEGRHDAEGDTLPGYVGYRANVAKAWRILDGDLSALRGPKVTAFAGAIVGDMSHVTVDVWATRTARDGRRALAFHAWDDEMPGAVEHRAIAEAYRRAAALRGITPSAMQAVVWVAVRGSGAFPRVQAMTDVERRRYYRRQVRAREAIGLQATPTYAKNPVKRAAVLQAVAA